MTYPLSPTHRYREAMADDEDPAEEITYFLGIPVTAAGKARARRQLDEARARMTPERVNEMRARIGLPPVDPATAATRRIRLGMPVPASRQYPEAMEHDTDAQTDSAAATAAVGTPQGREDARKLLADGRDRMSRQDWDALREQFGVRVRHVA